MNLLKLNLQLFAEDEISENTQEVAEPVEKKEDEINDEIFVDDDVAEQPTNANQSEGQDEPTSANNQEIAEPETKTTHGQQQSDEDNSKFAAARRQAENEKRLAEQRMNQFARDLGYNSFEELEQVQAQQKYLDANPDYTPEMAERMVRMDKLENEMRQRENQARIQSEKASLRNQKYFSEVEAELDQLLVDIPEANVQALFDMLKGRNMDKLIAQETKAAKQRALNSLNNKDHIKPGGKGVEGTNSVHVDPEEFKIAKSLDPKLTMNEYMKWKKNNT